MVSKVTRQIELAFWDFAIQAMAESRFVQEILKAIYEIKQHPDKIFAVVCASGLVAGIITGMGVFFAMQLN